MAAQENNKRLKYWLKPCERGEYHFGRINVFLRSHLSLAERRTIQGKPLKVEVFPSIIQMKKYELKGINHIMKFYGLKRLRKIGHSYEFDTIKNYVTGDDYRSINWKATSRHNLLMVNQYEDEKSQQVYSIIDKSRSMKLPFGGLSLMDYAINSSLVISNTVLKKYDKAGLITFSDKIDSIVAADRGKGQLNKILEILYNEQESPFDANYEGLYLATKKIIKNRSLLFLYTNFESLYAMERVLPVLRRINALHLLVVMFFENTEIVDFSRTNSKNMEEVYVQTIAQKFITEKFHILQKLKQFGIQVILSRPENLSVNTINKYLELKSRGLI